MPNVLGELLVTLEGSLATRVVVTRAAPLLLAQWNGGTHRVAYVRVSASDASFSAGFWRREDALRITTEGAPLSWFANDRARTTWTETIAALDRGSRLLQCLVFSASGCLLVEFRSEELCRAVDPVRQRDLRDFLRFREECSSRAGALHCVHETLLPLLLHRAEKGATSGQAPLDLLEGFVAHRWDETSFMLFAVTRARGALRNLPRGPDRNRAALAIEALREGLLARLETRPTAMGGWC